jgi:hypothetical protein
MEPLLTLVIAVGGIATGIGAIWAAMVARRQAQITERTLAEQNERSRLNLEVDLLSKLADRFESPHFVSRRRAAAKYLIDNAFVEDDIVEVPHLNTGLNTAAYDVLNFFEGVGYLQRLGALQAESVWQQLGLFVQAYWLVCKPTVEKLREEWGNPAVYEEFERLNRVVTDLDREQGIAANTQEWLHRLMTDEAVRGEEPPPTTE